MPTVTMVACWPMTVAITPICTSMKARPIPTAIASMLVANQSRQLPEAVVLRGVFVSALSGRRPL